MSEEACECEKVKILYRGLMQFKADSQLNLSVYHSNISVDVKLLVIKKMISVMIISVMIAKL